jgi:hypothetical protein
MAEEVDDLIAQIELELRQLKNCSNKQDDKLEKLLSMAARIIRIFLFPDFWP